MFPTVQFVINKDITATFCMLIVSGALALIVVIFAINQVVGLFGGVASAVGDVARGDFSGATTRSKKVNCHNCKSFHFDSKGKPSCYTCGRLWSTEQKRSYYKERNKIYIYQKQSACINYLQEKGQSIFLLCPFCYKKT